MSFNPKKKMVTFSGVIGAVSKSRVMYSRTKFTYLQLMALFGSLNCFKYAISTDAYDINDIAKYAVAGGNKEIIHILGQNVSFDSCFEVSVKYHRYEVSDWLLTNHIILNSWH